MFVSIGERAVLRTCALALSSEKTVEDVGEFAFRIHINSPTVFLIRSEKEKSPDAREKLQKRRKLNCELSKFERESSIIL